MGQGVVCRSKERIRVEVRLACFGPGGREGRTGVQVEVNSFSSHTIALTFFEIHYCFYPSVLVL